MIEIATTLDCRIIFTYYIAEQKRYAIENQHGNENYHN